MGVGRPAGAPAFSLRATMRLGPTFGRAGRRELCRSQPCLGEFRGREPWRSFLRSGSHVGLVGTIAFFADGNRSGAGRIEEDGTYTVSDAPIGDVKVTVSVPSIGGMAGMMGGKVMPKPPGGGVMKDPNDPGPGTPSPSIDPKKIVQIPEKYSKVETSGLTFKVEKGDNTFDIKLTP